MKKVRITCPGITALSKVEIYDTETGEAELIPGVVNFSFELNPDGIFRESRAVFTVDGAMCDITTIFEPGSDTEAGVRVEVASPTLP